MPTENTEANTDAVRCARVAWELFQAADGCGVVLTDDDLLAEFLADQFGVRPDHLNDEYCPEEAGDTD